MVSVRTNLKWLAWIGHVTHSKCPLILFPILAKHLLRNFVRSCVVKLTSLFLPRANLTSSLLGFVHPNTARMQVVPIATLDPLSLPTQYLKTRMFFLNWRRPSPWLGSPPSLVQQSKPLRNCSVAPNPQSQLILSHHLPPPVSIL